MEFKLWLEQFDTAFDFLLNKDYTDKTFSDLLQDFEDSGGKWIGAGKSGKVFSHPSWKYVLKTFEDDACYLKFVRFAYQNLHPSFPKFYGLPRRILPQFKRQSSYLYYVRIERLFPVQDEVMLNYVMWTYNSSHYLSVGQDEINRDFAIKKAYDDQEEKFNYLRLKNLSLRSQGQAQFEIPPRSIRDYDYNKNLLIFADTLKKYPQIKPLLEGYEILLKRNFQCAMDMHKGNIMQRQNGELVLIDPLWYGSNPYADADRQRRMETDSMDQQEEEPKMIRGGQLPRKLKKAKVPIRAKLLDKETPF